MWNIFQCFAPSAPADEKARTLEEALGAETRREVSEWLDWHGWPASEDAQRWFKAAPLAAGTNGRHPNAAHHGHNGALPASGRKKLPAANGRQSWVDLSAGA